MCGFIAIFDQGGAAERHREALARGLSAIRHRGPDDDGIAIEGPTALGFRRLSILDLSPSGHQPMVSQDGNWTLVFNGEIYNFLELRAELERQGRAFRSDSDTEVLVELLARDGIEALERCNGMWGLAAWHAPSQRLYVARDPWGIKPVYVTEQRGWVAFGSEIKAFGAMGCDLGGIDPETASRFLAHHEMDTDTRTFWRGVRAIAPGAVECYAQGVPHTVRSSGDGAGRLPPALAHGDASEDTWVDAFRDALLSAVRLRMRADVDAGTCLSGGLDSTVIACATGRFLSAERASNCRHAFTAHAPEFDERRYIEPVIAQIDAQWHLTEGTPGELTDLFPLFRAAHDQPVHSLAALSGFSLMRLANRNGVRVLLNGQGADELLAGYHSTIVPWLRTIRHERGHAYALAEAIRHAGSRRRGLRLFAQAEAGTMLRTMPPEFEARARQLRQRLEPGLRAGLWLVDGPLGRAHPRSRPESDDLHRTLLDAEHKSPLPTYLRLEDINASAFSLEARLPFLDPQVVAIARAAPAWMLRRGPLNKYLLRAAMPGLVPEVVWKRKDKMGFPVPQGRWLRGPLRSHFESVLSDDAIAARGWYDVARVRAARDAFLRDDHHQIPHPLLRVFLLEMWAQDHFDRYATRA
ncbi:MAG: Asparagine synthetase [Pseudomonadota bacterium]